MSKGDQTDRNSQETPDVEVELIRGPSKEWIEARLEERLTYTQMAEQWGGEIPPRKIYRRAKYLGIAPDRRRRNDWELPWTIAERHRNHKYYWTLHYIAQLNRGDELPPRKRRVVIFRLREFAKLDSPASIAYERDSPDGFYLVEREDGDREVADPSEWGKDFEDLPKVWIAPPEEA